jgi:hypothetical protein
VKKNQMNHRRTKLPRAAVSVDFLIYWLQRVAVPAAFFDLLCHTGCASPRVYCIFFSNRRRFQTSELYVVIRPVVPV